MIGNESLFISQKKCPQSMQRFSRKQLSLGVGEEDFFAGMYAKNSMCIFFNGENAGEREEFSNFITEREPSGVSSITVFNYNHFITKNFVTTLTLDKKKRDNCRLWLYLRIFICINYFEEEIP